MLSENEQSWLFLREFTREILTNIGNMYLRQELRKEIREKLIDVLKNKDRILEEIDASNYTPKLNLEVLKSDINDPSQKVDDKKLIVNQPKQIVIDNKPGLTIKSDIKLNLGKVNDLLNDQDIYSIECLGPKKFLISKKPNKVDISPIVLSEEEIKKIISVFASLTNTYPSEGVFDANYKNYSITAVLSDLAGSRFIITRYLDPAKLIEK